MAHHNTVFSQILKLVPRHEFESFARKHHQDHELRKMTRWSQFVSLGLAQLARCVSMRDVVSNLKAQARKLCHLGCAEVDRSSLARVNEQQPASLYETLFGRLLSPCQGLSPKHRFRFKNKLYSLDASIIDPCLSVFPRAEFRSTKLHLGLEHDGYRDTDTGKHYVFLTNNLRLSSRSIATIYRERWQIKLFFRWIKQNLKIKTLLATSRNAVLI